MDIKLRQESRELKIYRSLHERSCLSTENRHHYMNLAKGYEGEVLLDARMKHLSNDWLMINDLRLDYNKTVFQIDKLLISSEKMYALEVKNLEGDYAIKGNGKWVSVSSDTEIKNPLHQVNRSEIYLQKVTKELGINIPIESALIFINPDFFLYNAPLDQPIIYPHQLKRLIKRLGNRPPGYTDSHINFARKLASMHLEDSPYTRLPEYHYNELKKGVICKGCGSFELEGKKHSFTCKKCGKTESVTSSVLSAMEEVHLLFPERKITTNLVHDWCKETPSKKSIQRILSQNLKQIGTGKHAYYEKE